MPPSDPVPLGGHQPTYADAANAAARLVAAFDTDGYLAELLDAIGQSVALDNFIVFAYREGFAADLVFTNLEIARLAGQMAPYTAGLYLLDPFYVADMTDRRAGLLRLDDIAPQDFRESEFFVRFYGSVGVLDELHYVVRLEPGRSVHVFIEREQERFTETDVARLSALEPIVSNTVRRHWAWMDQRSTSAPVSPIQVAGGIDGVIRNMRPGQLTPREVEVVGLSLRGHSSKLIAHELGISEGTVTNHKRNVYEKLGIHSQTQLFSLFLVTLAGEPA